MDYTFWLKAKNLKIVVFYPYTTSVTHRILTQNFNYKTEEHDFLEALWNELAAKAEEMGIALDNKIAFKCVFVGESNVNFEEQSPIYIGRYDGNVHVGFGVYQKDSWTWTCNRTFE
jgi:sulfatase maturation enzyme AslB (radical SAM superfamily)